MKIYIHTQIHTTNLNFLVTQCVQTYTMSRSQSAQMFWPGGSPLFEGGFGTCTGAVTCCVTGATTDGCSGRWCGAKCTPDGLYTDDGLAKD